MLFLDDWKGAAFQAGCISEPKRAKNGNDPCRVFGGRSYEEIKISVIKNRGDEWRCGGAAAPESFARWDGRQKGG